MRSEGHFSYNFNCILCTNSCCFLDQTHEHASESSDNHKNTVCVLDIRQIRDLHRKNRFQTADMKCMVGLSFQRSQSLLFISRPQRDPKGLNSKNSRAHVCKCDFIPAMVVSNVRESVMKFRAMDTFVRQQYVMVFQNTIWIRGKLKIMYP